MFTSTGTVCASPVTGTDLLGCCLPLHPWEGPWGSSRWTRNSHPSGPWPYGQSWLRSPGGATSTFLTEQLQPCAKSAAQGAAVLLKSPVEQAGLQARRGHCCTNLPPAARSLWKLKLKTKILLETMAQVLIPVSSCAGLYKLRFWKLLASPRSTTKILETNLGQCIFQYSFERIFKKTNRKTQNHIFFK